METLKFEVTDGVGVVTLSRPEKMNALSATMLDELGTLLADVEQGEVGALVVTGGPDVFSVGADLGDASGGLDERTPVTTTASVHRTMALFDRMARHPKPIVAAIAGMALGGGAELALACDLRIAGDTASIGFPEVKLGVLPAGGGTQRVARLAGQARALELLLTGDPVTAEEAAAAGLVNRVVAAGELMPAAMEVAGKLARRPPLALATIKQVVRAGLDGPLHTGLELEAQAAALLMATDDAREGIAAFVEKRKPHFRGR